VPLSLHSQSCRVAEANGKPALHCEKRGPRKKYFEKMYSFFWKKVSIYLPGINYVPFKNFW